MFSKRYSFDVSLRIIAALLLTAIVWGSSVNLNHSHATRAPNQTETAGNLSGAAPSDKSNNTSVQDTRPGRSSSRQNTASECLICQLHHNLATTLLSEPASVNAMHSQSVGSLTPARVHLLEFTTAQRGRAPPLSFLS